MSGSQKIVVLVIFSFVFTANHSHSATHTVSGDCSASAVQAAITAASSGDIIDVACTGTVTWSSPIVLSGGKRYVLLVLRDPVVRQEHGRSLSM